MATIHWTDTLSVNIPSIDKQHKKLVDLINDFYLKIQTKPPKELMLSLIESLKQYTVYHFSTEEKYMKLNRFPGYLQHKAEHDKFVETVLDFENRYLNGDLILTIEVTGFIKDWVANHIIGTDKKYSTFLYQKGVR